ncbi:MAG TPA: bifunctional 3-(3-hydroxy-phenyl)propionate/3-hydroxycinnamic acid hydroxylase [Solirubrobacteraceae bacterium]|jgi:2-polyprenyl-6-methoxyphenol hydroxylase-like FAD-dependent oxidoreductase|nr:bifunctional 3-(3-hydroxy-phenyl)propionate/3-hydroxycinnamic acid hydroxylase [Solirubrobacteraceae bacterium]
MTLDYDIAIVGYGPVGQTAAILLGRLGYRVGVFERWPSLYPRPRAVHYDDEVARVFQRLGLSEQLRAITEPATMYEWQNDRGETLLLVDRTEPGPSGWAGATMFSQPQLEELLDGTAKSVPSVEVHQGWEVRDVRDTGDCVLLTVREGSAVDGQWIEGVAEREARARYVIGCDGANSIVRARMGTPVEDLGFAFDWLIADTVPRDRGLLSGVNLQRCDPARPTTLVSGGPGRRRWEWMLLPGETREQVEDPKFVRALLARSGIGAEEVALERHTVYTFRARWAERWREGRMLLAGDAAHLMPPFAGQGMCAGIRDALTLAWHLDVVLKGQADSSTLGAYTSERCAHVRQAIAISVELGKVICIADETEAAARDAGLLALLADPDTPEFEVPAGVLGPGIHEGPDGARPGGGGSLFPQGRVSVGGAEVLLEDTIGGGFALYALDTDPIALLELDARLYLEALDCALVRVESGEQGQQIYDDWFSSRGCAVALVRPDFYVFGTAAASVAETSALVRRLQTALNDPYTDEKRPAI